MVKLLQFPTQHGTFYTCHNDIVFVDYLSRGLVFEEDILAKHILPLFQKMDPSIPKIILDVGGHIGSHTIMYANYIPNAIIHTFEPQRILFNILNMNLVENNITGVKTYHSAVGEMVGECTLSSMLYDGYNVKVSYDTDQMLNYGGLSVGTGGEKVNIITIDSLDLPECHYIKMDVEGAEPLVLLGALKTIRKYKPFIMLEYTDKRVSDEMKESLGINKDRIIEDPLLILEKEGYQFKRIEGENVLAIPLSI